MSAFDPKRTSVKTGCLSPRLWAMPPHCGSYYRNHREVPNAQCHNNSRNHSAAVPFLSQADDDISGTYKLIVEQRKIVETGETVPV